MQEHLKQIREKFNQQQNLQLIRKQQEKEFLNQLQNLESMEDQQKQIGKKLLLDDMNSTNFIKQLENQENQNLKQEIKKVDQYNYFPFVGSETVERQRSFIKSQLKDDLLSYLNYQQQAGKLRSRQKLDFSSLKSENNSEITEKANEFYTKNMNQVIKHLYDSSYVLPKDNYRVFQDTHPVKSAVLNEAQKRFEQDLQFKNKLHD